MFSQARKDTFSFVEYRKVSLGETPLGRTNNKPRKQKCNCFTIVVVLSVCLMLMGIVTLIANLIYNPPSNPPTFSDYVLEDQEMRCTNVEIERFDCWPEIDGATEEKCNERGCCWSPSSHPGTAPYCFYPMNYNGYNVTAMKETDTGIEATLVRNSSSFFSKDVPNVRLNVEYISDFILRIKLYDPKNKRYEVPLHVPTRSVSSPEYLAYTVNVEKSPFNIYVKRKTAGEILFDTRDTAPLIFSDQYLQISTQLSTKYFYGLGEHRSNLLHDLSKWERLVFWNRDDYPKFDNNGYGSHPFLLNLERSHNQNNTRWQNDSHGIFLLNSNAGEVALQPFAEDRGALTYRFIGGVLDFFIMTGPDPVSVISQYTSIIGRPYLPPFWSLGFHLCRWGYNSSERLQQVINRNRDAAMPYDVQWNDIDYMEDHKDWTYANKSYSTLPDVVKNLHDNDQRYVIIVDPALSSEQPQGSYPPYDDGIDMNVFVKTYNGSVLIGKVWPGLTAFPDFFHPNASTYLYKQASSFHQQIPFDGLWIDMNEPSSFIDGSTEGCSKNSFDHPPYVPPTIDTSMLTHTICPSAQQYLSQHYNLHNMYGWSNANASRTALNQIFPDKRSLLISRSSFAGSGRFTGHWLGDNYASYDDLFYSIPGILRFNLFGIPQIGADICGFRGATNPELCTRWMQLGSFYPFMRNHNTLGSPDQDPAAFASPYKGYMRTALQQRYQMLPILYTLFYKAHMMGEPVVRPLMFMYPGTEAIDKQFMWGDQLLISPVLTQGQTSVEAYMPEGFWYDFYNGTILNGTGQYVTLSAPLNHINVHVRGGSIVTLLPPTLRTDQARKEKFFIIIAPDEEGKASGDFFWDDGESQSSISDGHYSKVGFSFSEGHHFLSEPEEIGYNPPEGILLQAVIALNVASAPTEVSINGRLANATYDESTKTLTIDKLVEDLLTNLDIFWI